MGKRQRDRKEAEADRQTKTEIQTETKRMAVWQGQTEKKIENPIESERQR